VNRRDLREEVGILREGAQVIGTDDLKTAARLKDGGIIADSGQRVGTQAGPLARKGLGEDIPADL
jgi:hypothetical protein